MTTRVLIVGGGFGGLETAFSLKVLLKPPFEISLIDKSAYHSFIPSIHLIISNNVTPDMIRIPFRTILNPANIRFVHGEALSMNAATREVATTAGTLPYDYLVLSSGAENNFFDIPGAEEFSSRFRTPEDAERIRTALVCLMDSTGKPCRIKVAGAGTEGVEVIGELLDLIRKEGREGELDAGRITIEMIEGKNRLLPSLPIEVQNRVEDYLRRQGVILTSGDRIAEVMRDGIVLTSGQKRDASILIWSGGVQPSKLIRNLPLAKNPSGWLKVNDRLHVPEDDRIYGIGDAVCIYTDDGPIDLQRLAYHAQDQARVAAMNIHCHCRGKGQTTYEPKSRPQLISLGKDMGIFSYEERVYSGAWVVSLKKTLERSHLMRYLAMPVSSMLLAKIPGVETFYRLRTKSPL